MSNKSIKKTAKRWKMALSILTIIALVSFVYAIRKQIVDTLSNLQNVNIWAIAFMPLFQLVNYHAYTRMYQHIFRFLKSELDYKTLFKTQLELNFVNNVFPSGGVSGISYFGLRFRSQGIGAGKATLIQIIKFGLLFVSFQVLLLVGLLVLAIGNQASNLLILIAGSISTFLFIGTFGLAFMLGSQQRINSFFTYITRVLNKLIHIFRKKHPETIRVDRVRRLFDELHENYKLIRSHPKQLKKPLFYGLLANVTEILTIYAVYVAFGSLVNPGAVIIAYAVANIAGTISILPGGIGVYEFLMTATLAVSGVPASLSVSVTVMYRILNTLIQIIPGYYFYNKAIHHRQADEELAG
jgi:glycosyltransferase 2 family protein